MVSAAAAGRLPARVGDVFTKRLRLTTAEIRAFARTVDDLNPLHHDAEFAARPAIPA